MLSSLFPCCRSRLQALLWQAFRVMSRFRAASGPLDDERANGTNDRTGRITVHPELLDQDGRLTDEDLLTVRFSSGDDSPDGLREESGPGTE